MTILASISGPTPLLSTHELAAAVGISIADNTRLIAVFPLDVGLSAVVVVVSTISKRKDPYRAT